MSTTITISELQNLFSDVTKLSKKQYRLDKMLKSGGVPTRRKGRGNVAVIDGKEFDSTLELARYLELLTLQDLGVITGLSRQNKFVILPKFDHPDGKQREMIYTDDFSYFIDGIRFSEDVKASKFAKGIAQYNIKIKLLRHANPDTRFVTVYSDNIEGRLQNAE